MSKKKILLPTIGVAIIIAACIGIVIVNHPCNAMMSRYAVGQTEEAINTCGRISGARALGHTRQVRSDAVSLGDRLARSYKKHEVQGTHKQSSVCRECDNLHMLLEAHRMFRTNQAIFVDKEAPLRKEMRVMILACPPFSPDIVHLLEFLQ